MNRKLTQSAFTIGRSDMVSGLEGDVQGEVHPVFKEQQTVGGQISESNAADDTSPYGEFLRESYKQKEVYAKETLRVHLGSDIVFTETWTEVEYERELEEEELMEGEVSASVFKVGCYTVRMAYCLYVDDRGRNLPYTEKVPAEKEKLIAYRKEEKRIGQESEEDGFTIAGLCPIGKMVRMVTEVAAMYGSESGAAMDSWQNICMAAPDHEGSGSIEYICTVKKDDKTPDGQAVLFILKLPERNPDSVGIWYKFTPDGKVEQYRGDDSKAAGWEL